MTSACYQTSVLETHQIQPSVINPIVYSLDYLLNQPIIHSIDDLRSHLISPEIGFNPNFHQDLLKLIYYWHEYVTERQKETTRNLNDEDYTDYHSIPVADWTAYLATGQYITRDLPIDYKCVTILTCAGEGHDLMENEGATHDEIIEVIKPYNPEIAEKVAAYIETATKFEIGNKGQKIKEFTYDQVKDNILNLPNTILILTADRAHNLLTADGLTPDKQIRQSVDTLFQIAPLAADLGYSDHAETLRIMAIANKHFSKVYGGFDNLPFSYETLSKLSR